MIICSCQNVNMTLSAVGRYWRGTAQMMNSHKLLIGELELKTIFDCEDKIKTDTKGIGCETVVCINPLNTELNPICQ